MAKGNPGVLIGATFGLAFIVINAGTLPTGVAFTVRILGVAGYLGLIGLMASSHASAPDPSSDRSPPAMFGRGYWMIVLAEVAAGMAGLIVINGLLDHPDAGVAWIALVVGLHFIGLAAIWHEPSVGWLGAAIALCGLAGLLLAAADASEATIATVGGIIPGVLLLGGSWWATLGHQPQ
jgi:hypothetical protein